MLLELMSEADATLVRKIPLSRANKKDRLNWQDSTIGMFSIKSVYYKACRILGREGVDREHKDRLLKDVLTAKVTLKIKFFMWKLIHSFKQCSIHLTDSIALVFLSFKVLPPFKEHFFS